MPKFEKGSQEARDYMAKLRAARKPKMAGSTRGDGIHGGEIGDSIKKTFKKASKAVKKTAMDAVSAIGGEIPDPPSRLPSSLYNPTGGRMMKGSDSDEEALHDCPMCVGMGIVKKKRIY